MGLSPLKYGPAKIERKRVKNRFLLILCMVKRWKMMQK